MKTKYETGRRKCFYFQAGKPRVSDGMDIMTYKVDLSYLIRN
jgi:hypothetical protein